MVQVFVIFSHTQDKDPFILHMQYVSGRTIFVQSSSGTAR